MTVGDFTSREKARIGYRIDPDTIHHG